MSTVIVMPFHDPDGTRFRAASWVRQRLEALHPRMRLVVATDGGTPWCKATAVNRAVPADADVVVVCDADVAVPAKALDWAVAWVENGEAWAVPCGTTYRLTIEATTQALARPPTMDIEHVGAGECIQNRPPYDAVPGGGIFAVARDAWAAVGGFDERFLHGSEDVPLGYALDTLAGDHEQLPAPLWHLWHPARRAHIHGQHPQQMYHDQALEARYLAARGKPDAMRALIGERAAGKRA